MKINKKQQNDWLKDYLHKRLYTTMFFGYPISDWIGLWEVLIAKYGVNSPLELQKRIAMYDK